MADTSEAYMDMAGSRISFVTSSPLRYIRCSPISSYRRLMVISGSTAATAAASLGSIWWRYTYTPMVR